MNLSDKKTLLLFVVCAVIVGIILYTIFVFVKAQVKKHKKKYEEEPQFMLRCSNDMIQLLLIIDIFIIVCTTLFLIVPSTSPKNVDNSSIYYLVDGCELFLIVFNFFVIQALHNRCYLTKEGLVVINMFRKKVFSYSAICQGIKQYHVTRYRGGIFLLVENNLIALYYLDTDEGEELIQELAKRTDENEFNTQLIVFDILDGSCIITEEDIEDFKTKKRHAAKRWAVGSFLHFR